MDCVPFSVFTSNGRVSEALDAGHVLGCIGIVDVNGIVDVGVRLRRVHRPRR